MLYTGYREANTNYLKITCSYKNFINSITAEAENIAKEELKNLEVVLPYSEI